MTNRFSLHQLLLFFLSLQCVRGMAYAALVSLEQTIDEFLNHDNQNSTSLHRKQQIICLDKYVIMFQAFLDDFPEEGNDLEGRIKDVAKEAEEIIECFIIEQIRARRRFINWIAELAMIKLGFQLKKVMYQMDSVAGEVAAMKNSFRVDFTASGSSSRAAPARKNHMVGFDEDLIKIKDRLCGESPKLEVLPVVGMGGIGKTTLARNAFDDQLIKEHFQIRVWVTISQEYSRRQILSSLVDSMKEFSTERFEQSTDEMALQAYQTLKGRRYLVVMDDMWSTKAWDDVRSLFPDDCNGSRIMLTTRLSDVAAYPDTCSPLHEMQLMDGDNSWTLLRAKVFFAYQDCTPALEKIGKEIARSCGGLPLALVLIAGVLTTVSKSPGSWMKIAKSISSIVGSELENILSLSYYHLPHHLRPCFLYMGGFPEDHEIRISRLLKLWVAEGFLKRSDGSKSLEEGAEECLEDLVRRNLVLVAKADRMGRIKSCSLHDRMRDLCIRLSEEEKLLLYVTGKHARKVALENIENRRHLSIANSDLNTLANTHSSTIRTILYFQTKLESFGTFRLLRVLDVLRVKFTSYSLPSQFFELFHLRYFAFCYQDTVPPAISNLRNLQTLIIHSTCLYLPFEIWTLLELRHLILPATASCELPDIKEATCALQNLHTLKEVENLKCSRTTFEKIPNLRTLGLVYDRNKVHLLDFQHLRQLERLKITVRTSYLDCPFFNAVLPSSLKKLTLDSWTFGQDFVGPLPNLEVLKLIRVCWESSVWETREGDFPKLKFLLISEPNLEEWIIEESSHFPELECILLDRCRFLNGIPDVLADISTLDLIQIVGRKKSLVHSAEQIEGMQQDYGNYAFQVRCMDYRDYGGKLPW